jgi:tRNA-modifying protein YgfZ
MVAVTSATAMNLTQLLPERAIIALSGDGVLAFLQNLLTCDLEAFQAGQIGYGALLTPQGKILHDMFIHHAGDAIYLDVARSQRDAVLQKLKLYRLRAKFDITARDDLQVAVGTEGIADPRHADIGSRAVGDFPRLSNTGDYHARRIALGLADSDADLGVGQYFPHEANFDKISGVSFKKGCYVGQEVVSRMQHRGTARSRMVPVRIDGVVTQDDIRAGDVAVGTLLSRAGDRAIAILRLDRVEEATLPLMAGTARIMVSA